MDKKSIVKAFSTVILAGMLTSSVTFAGDMDMSNMEKCMFNKNGKTMIKADKADGGSGTGAWVWVMKGDCDKINNGNWDGVSDDVKAKFDWDTMNMMK